ncbi:DExH-box splicing factor binding site family protein [Cryptosporidium felis]|nr:DExH-box splicing factor binding site family protein [Cryptosporidium felis]
MENSKFGFSLKIPKEKNEIGKNPLFQGIEQSEQETKEKTGYGSGSKAFPGKRTQITSFSKEDLKTEQGGESDSEKEEDLVIECKSRVGSSEGVNSIEILLEKKKKRTSYPDAGESEPTNDSNSFSIPVNKFGLAMLKGMGYDPAIHNTQPKIFKKKSYNQSGLGADKEIGKQLK